MTNSNVLFQHGTLALLVPGLLDGTITMKELLQHGDTGIGTGEGLDGELMILDGVPYQTDGTGKVNIVSDDFTLPFANSHFAKYEKLMSVENISRPDLQSTIINKVKSANTFYSLRIHGTFKNMKARAVRKSTKPYQTLAQTAENQNIFDSELIDGTLLSYYSPEVFDGAAVAGFHSHFLADDHQFGGHILSFESVTGDVKFQRFDSLEQHLPTDNKEFMEHDFTKDDIINDIHSAEK
ncbi:acetolactate decarboxylase [Companilactobacillus mishanensis]|uniref:Alpha-acetolactate decarboxylase n=1 Tax=Companilactobacillus mishanensis TaxID=2486008 RepID=A0A5P0ZI29_9LACO|nr:acetolactate decarboxylase [Companilactobacillus mishanensis]MQS45201.1 acetolactate decarboxylase [Companilactobacillus mishanensis]MQS52704.1 acetolactate decarboxylase [Companilactobacillus mishanensis]